MAHFFKKKLGVNETDDDTSKGNQFAPAQTGQYWSLLKCHSANVAEQRALKIKNPGG